MSIDPRLVLTPPMGFNTWNRFGGEINEQLVEATIDALIEEGLAGLGYTYLNIDDGWMAPERDRSGRLVPNSTRFPGGMARLADRAHANGLKLGIYSDCGTKTCMGLPASYDHERADIEMFASWGIDYLKCDWCHVPFEDFPGWSHRDVAKVLYGRVSEAIQDLGHPMVLSMCSWADGEPWAWARGIAHLWRTTQDIVDVYAGHHSLYGRDLVTIVQENGRLDSYSGPGGWNDPDMLEVGNGGMTPLEYRSHFALWCLMAAPLLIGTDIRAMSADTRAILTHRDLIAIDQDRLGIQARIVGDHDGVYTLVKPLVDGFWAVAVFNSTDTPVAACLDWAALVGPGSHRAEDLWNTTATQRQGHETIEVAAHETLVWKVAPAVEPQ